MKMFFLKPCQVIAATEEQNPSTLAAVGQETNGIFFSNAQYLVISCIVPEPTATSKSVLSEIHREQYRRQFHLRVNFRLVK